MVEIALVGYGAIAREHALALGRLAARDPDRAVRLRWVVGRLPDPTQAFAHEFGVPRWTLDLGEALADPAVTAVLVSSPTELHAGQSDLALRAGKHVLCEIPLATSLTEAADLVRLADDRNLTLMVCHTQRFAAPLIEARRLVTTGAVTPRSAVLRYLLDKRENVAWTGRRRSWTDDLLWHHGCHAVDAALWLLGDEAADITARAGPPDARLGIPMDLSVVLRTRRDVLVTVAMSYRAMPPLQDYLLVADETTLAYDGRELRDHRGVLAPADDRGIYDTAALDRQDAEFLAAVRDGREPEGGARSVLPAMAALQAAHDAIDQQPALPDLRQA
jgi:2-hydroxy-4-carboxymuconate semialdehyde hemiacetal dehydrogenase